MKEVLGSLPEVITAYKNYNLLVPTATDVQLNPFYKFHVEEVPVDLGENSGDIFKVGSVKTGKQDEKGKDIWEDVFSLSKPLLNKMAMAAGIQFNPKETYGERIDRVTYRAQAQGAMRKADGTARTETDQKVICLEDEEEKYRIEFADKAAKGITDEKQAQAAAEIFSGQWVESKNKWGKKCQAFVVAKEDRDRYIERSVMVNMALLKKTWAEKAMTGAKLRVIRALLGVKGTYETLCMPGRPDDHGNRPDSPDRSQQKTGTNHNAAETAESKNHCRTGKYPSGSSVCGKLLQSRRMEE